MMPTSWPLFAQAAEGPIRTTFELAKIQSNVDWILPIGALALILVFVYRMYRRDAVELNPALGWLLTALRTAVFLGLLILYLQPRWRTEQEKTINSRVLLLADTSLSMSLTDADSAAGGGPLRFQRGQSPAPHSPLPSQAGEGADRLKRRDRRPPG